MAWVVIGGYWETKTYEFKSRTGLIEPTLGCYCHMENLLSNIYTFYTISGVIAYTLSESVLSYTAIM